MHRLALCNCLALFDIRIKTVVLFLVFNKLFYQFGFTEYGFRSGTIKCRAIDF